MQTRRFARSASVITALSAASLLLVGSATALAAPAGTITATYQLTDTVTGLATITSAPDGKLWFGGYGFSSNGNGVRTLGNGTTSGNFSSFLRDDTDDRTPAVAVTSDGAAWYATVRGTAIRVDPNGAVTRIDVTPTGLVDVAAGPDGNAYFADPLGGRMWKLTSTGVATPYPLPAGGPFSLAAGPDGRMWIAAPNVNAILAFDIGTSTFATYGTGDPSIAPLTIGAGPDGNMWFLAQSNGVLGSITPTGTYSYCSSLNVNQAEYFTTGPDGNIWVTERDINTVARISPSCAMTEFPTPGLDRPGEIVSGADGRLWFLASGFLATITVDGTIETHEVMASSRVPMIAAVAPDGSIWFSEIAGNAIGHLFPDTGHVDTYELRPPTIPDMTDWPLGIALAPDGSVWFTLLADGQIGRLDPSTGTIALHTLPNGYRPLLVRNGPDGNLWVSTLDGHILRVDPATVTMTDFALPDTSTVPADIITGADGNLWISEEFGDAVTVMRTDGVILNRITLPAGSFPVGGTLGPDGNIWVAEMWGNAVARITPGGAVTQFALPTAYANPNLITVGPDHNLWVSEAGGNKIARITTAGVITEFPLPKPNMVPTGIVSSPDGHLYVATQLGNSLLKMSLGIPFTLATRAGSPQGAIVQNAFATPLQARVTDSDGDPVAGVTVTFHAPTSGASGTFLGTADVAAVTDAAGVATAPTFTANEFVGNYAIEARVAELPAQTARFDLANLAAPPAQTTSTTAPIPTTTAAPAPPRVPTGALPRTGADTSRSLTAMGLVLFALGSVTMGIGLCARRRVIPRTINLR